MSIVLSLRLNKNEQDLIEQAAKLEALLGDRSGVSGWMRRVLLQEAQRVVDAANGDGSVE